MKGLRRLTVGPGPREIREAVVAFARKPGTITALSDGRLPALKEALPDEHDVDVLGFGELVGNILRGYGEPTPAIVTRGQMRALVALACADLPGDSPLYASSRFHGTHEALATTLSELRNWRYNIETLEQLGEASRLAGDLATIVRAVDSGLERMNRTTLADRMERCFRLGSVAAPHRNRLLVIGDAEGHPLAEAWLQWIADAGAEVTLVEESPSCGNATGWASRLFNQEAVSVGRDEGPEVTITSAADSLAECEWALRGCLEAVDRGILPHRIAIVARESESYAPLLIAAAERLGVKLDIAVQAPLLTNGLVSFVLTTIEALAGRDIRRLSETMRFSYAGLTRADRTEALEAIRMAARSTEPWDYLYAWAEERGTSQGWLAHALRWRKEALSEPGTLGTWHERVRRLIEGGGLIERIAFSQDETRMRDQSGHTAMLRAIADMATAYGPDQRRALTLPTFATTIRRLWEPESFVLRDLDGRVKVSTSAERLGKVDVLFVLGLLEGVLPRRRTEDPILSDEVRQWLSAMRPDLPALPDSTSIGIRERIEFMRICSTPTKELILSYPQTGENRDNIPAFYLGEVERIVGGSSIKKVDHKRVELTPSAEDCKSPRDGDLARAMESMPKTMPEPPKLGSVVARILVRPDFEGAGLDPRELAWALECPFRAASRFRLSLFPGARRDPWGRLMRLPAKASLPAAPDRETAELRLRAALRDELDRLLGELDYWEVGLIETGAERFIQGWIDREFESRELWGEDPNLRTNVSLDDPDLENILPGPEKRAVKLVGQVTSLSTLGPYSRIQSYARRAPRDLRIGESGEIDSDTLLYGLFAVMESRRRQHVSIEVDSADGMRTLYVLPRLADGRFRTVGHLRVMPLGDSREQYLRPIILRFREAVEELDKARMEAHPSAEGCRLCDYGELCRVSARFGDTVDSPFES